MIWPDATSLISGWDDGFSAHDFGNLQEALSTLVLTRLSKASEFIFISKHEQLGLVENPADKGTFVFGFSHPLADRHQVGIDRSCKILLSHLQRGEDLGIGQSFSNDHHVDVAVCGVFALGDRAIDECGRDRPAVGRECFPKRIDDADGFQDQLMQLMKHRRLPVRMVELSIAIGGGGHDPHLGELFELALNGAAPGAGL